MFRWVLDKLRDSWWDLDRKHHIRDMQDRESVYQEFHIEESEKVVFRPARTRANLGQERE
jgi:hypothetical protein